MTLLNLINIINMDLHSEQFLYCHLNTTLKCARKSLWTTTHDHFFTRFWPFSNYQFIPWLHV